MEKMPEKKNLPLAILLHSTSIAVIGASNKRQKVGHQIFRNLLLANKEAGKKKKFFPINPTSQSILEHKAYPQISTILEPIDLVIIVTPAPTIPTLIDEIISRNKKFAKNDQVKGVIIISAGFAETSKEGRDVQHIIATKLKLAGIHLLGPNSLGCIVPAQGLNASFAQQHIPAGNIGIISQSGAMLTALFNSLENNSNGVSFAVSLGNKADLNENDCLEYALNDHDTEVIVMYLESFAHLPTFFELTSRISKKKPILLLKGGTSEQGQHASASHTAALATNQVLLQAASTQMGFCLLNNLEELTNLGFFLAHHRQAPSNVMVITNAGGPAVNTIDELSRVGVHLAAWSEKGKADLNTMLPQIAAHNPLDLLGDASPETFKYAISIGQHDLEVESILVIITPQSVTDIPGTVDQLIASKGKKPLFVALIGGEQLAKYRDELRQHNIFCTIFPNDIVAMMKYLQQIHQFYYRKDLFYFSAPHTSAYPIELYPSKLHLKQQVPSYEETVGLLQKNGIKVPEYTIVSANAQHFDQLNRFHFPVFAKTANLSLVHKQKIGAVYGKVESVDKAKEAIKQLSSFGNQILFQDALEIDQEILIGVENDEQFGLYLSVGLGGSYTNLLADRAYVLLPARREQLTSTWRETKAAQVIKKESQVVDVLEKIQKLVMQNPWIKNIEINPLVVNKDGVWAADIKIFGK
jgi:acyl-CoA synthetase (NDP forming)